MEPTENQRWGKGKNPNSLKNLKPFQTGISGNPNGRPPKNISLTSLLKEYLLKPVPGDKQGRTWQQVLVQAWVTGAMKNPVLLKELIERVDGKVLQTVGGDSNAPIIIRVVYEKASPKPQSQID